MVGAGQRAVPGFWFAWATCSGRGCDCDGSTRRYEGNFQVLQGGWRDAAASGSSGLCQVRDSCKTAGRISVSGWPITATHYSYLQVSRSPAWLPTFPSNIPCARDLNQSASVHFGTMDFLYQLLPLSPFGTRDRDHRPHSLIAAPPAASLQLANYVGKVVFAPGAPPQWASKWRRQRLQGG